MVPKSLIRYYLCALASLLLCLSIAHAEVSFTDSGISFPSSSFSAVAWGDFDADGDMDLAAVTVSGTGSSQVRATHIFQNNGSKFDDTGSQIIGFVNGTLAWSDYDADGDLDLVVAVTKDSQGAYPGATKIYRNDKGVFTDIQADLMPASYAAWGDCDNDGDLDLAVSGQFEESNMSGPVTRVYKNVGGKFVDTGTNLGAQGGMAWVDYDNDGDLDLSVGNLVFQNNGGTLLQVNAGLPQTSVGLAWGDYDNDGDLDVAVGSSAPSGSTKIYRNDAGKFVGSGAPLPTNAVSAVSWADYDNDGDLDILVSTSYLKIYCNTNGTFSAVEPGIVQASSPVAWADFDNDGDLDLVSRRMWDNRLTIYSSTGAPLNKKPAVPDSLSSVVSGRSVMFTWTPSSDQETPSLGLSYNLRIGSVPGGSDIFNGMADTATGFRRIPTIGNVQKRLSWTLNNLRGGTYYWSVQAIDPTLAGSSWPAEQSVAVDYKRISGRVVNAAGDGVADVIVGTDSATISCTTDGQGHYELWIPSGWTGSVTPAKAGYLFVPASMPYNGIASNADGQNYTGSGGFSKVDVGLPRLSGATAWGDYDGDGDMDLAISGNCSYDVLRPCKIFRNDGGMLTDLGASLPILNAKMAWGDYDNDGDLDLAICGWDGWQYFSAIYRNDAGTFIDTKANLLAAYGSVAWGDYDNDGDLDLIITGASDSSSYHSKIYRNDNGIFNDTAAQLMPQGGGSSAWGDYDNDGDLDLVLNASCVSKLYRNDRGVFVETGAQFTGSIDITAWGDYDNDSDLDLAIIGYTGSSSDYITKVYRNDAGTFVDILAGLPGLHGSLAWGDYDNDGDLDLVISGTTSTSLDGVLMTRIYRNDSGKFVDAGLGLPAAAGPVAFVDFDSDGDLDLIVSGITSTNHYSALPICAVYRNDIVLANTAPTAPGDLASSISEDGVAFSWGVASDDTTPPMGLSYNVRVGTRPGVADAFSGMASATSGLRQIPALGNAQKRLSWTVRLPAGTYYWSVQAVDAGYAGSIWAVEQRVTIDKLSISGRIVDSNGAGLPGVRIDATNGGGSYLTDSSGYYELWVPVGWNGTVAPNRPGYEIVPLKRDYANVTQNISSQDYTVSRTFTNVGAVLSGVAGCALAWGDYDEDGDLDLALESLGANNVSSARVYRDDAGQFVNTGLILPSCAYLQLAWIDYDNDGDLDLTLTGQDKSGQFACYIYRNTGGSLADSGIRLPNVKAFAWGDFDNDGRPDLAVTRAWYMDRWHYATGLYKNTPECLVDTGIDLSKVDAKFAWGDYDNDGDLDLILSGHIQSDFSAPSDYISTLYRNDSSVLTKVDAGIVGLSGSLAWGDYDNDGDLDLLISGYNGDIETNRCMTRIYRNDGGRFIDINAPLASVGWDSCAKWADYDNDGDLDIALTGSLDSHYGSTNIYRNDGGNFVLIDAGLPQLRSSSLDWGDFDNDGRVDLAVSGSITNGSDTSLIAGIYHNNYHVVNTAPAPPDGLSTTAGAGTVNFAWNAASDDQTPMSGLSYNIRVGTAPGGSDVFSGMTVPGTGLRLLPALGNAQKHLSWAINNLQSGTYYWSVQAIDGAYAGSQWAPEQTLIVDARKVSGRVQVARGPGLSLVRLSTNSGGCCYTDTDGNYQTWVPIGWGGSITPSKPGYTFIPASRSYSAVTQDMADQDFIGVGEFVDIGAGLPAIQYSSMAWGDYDQDGDLDLALCGSPTAGTGITKIFRNDDGKLTDSGIALPGYQYASLVWGDFDNDGDLDLVIAGGYASCAAKIYINNNGTFTETSAGLAGVSYGSVACGDYDNDGDLDLAIGGQLSSGSNIPRIYRNDGGSFADINAGLAAVRGSLSWADYDGDSDLDLLVAGYGSGSSSITTLYRNDAGKFVDSGAKFTGVYDCATAWGDYDNDGDLDLALAGWNQGRGCVALVYRNDRGNFVEHDAGLTGVRFASLVWGDCDGDGDLDLVMEGQGTNGMVGTICRNDNGVFIDMGVTLPGLGNGAATLGDFDGDGDLDLAICGSGSSVNLCAVFRNDGNKFDTPPSVPAALSAQVGGSVRFGWSAASDAETQPAGLSYNLRVGKTPGGQEISSAMADVVNGTRLTPALGNAGPNLTWGIKGLADGTYYWSVQAIDASFVGSPWSVEQTLVIDTRKISGYLRDGSSTALSGVIVKTGDGSDYSLTNANGYYELRVERGWSGRVFAEKVGLIFTPTYRDCSNVTEDLPNQDFIATPLFTSANAQFPTLSECTVAWGDYDNDGDLDLAFSGYTGTQAICRIYRNDAGTFTDIGAGLPGRRYCSLTWADFDNDGDLDLLCCGSINSVYSTRLYRNDAGNFVETNVGLPSTYGSYAWGDYDNDGDLDVLIRGSFGLSIYANNKGQFKLAKCGLPSMLQTSSALWVDYDNDGDLDIAFSGIVLSTKGVRIYRNDDGQFADQGVVAPITGGMVAGDYDNDGDTDLVICGVRYTGLTGTYVARVLRNDDGGFVEIDPHLGVSTSTYPMFVDFDSDGNLDLQVTTIGTTASTKLYYNNKGAFSDSGISLPSSATPLAWGDFDGDGSTDVVAASGSGSTISAVIYRNNSNRKNGIPSSPSDLISFCTPAGTTFCWKPGSDAETPTAGLSYNLRVGSKPGTCDLFSGMADPTTGRRLLPGNGNACQVLSWMLKGLPPTQYFWSVQAIDSCLAGSPWAQEQSLADISFAKSLDNGLPLRISGIITAVFADAFYIEKPNRISGIRVEGEIGGVQVGNVVSVQGTLTTNADKEMVIRADTPALVLGSAPVPKPWLMNLDAVGGGPLGGQTGVNDWRLVKDPETHAWSRQLSAHGGASNIGLLVKVTGLIRSVGDQYFYLDGTCAFDDGNEAVKGIRVDWPFAAPIPNWNGLVELTAISSCRVKAGVVVRMLRPISADAIRSLTRAQ